MAVEEPVRANSVEERPDGFRGLALWAGQFGSVRDREQQVHAQMHRCNESFQARRVSFRQIADRPIVTSQLFSAFLIVFFLEGFVLLTTPQSRSQNDEQVTLA